MGNPVRYNAIDVDEIYISGQKLEGLGKKIPSVSPIKLTGEIDNKTIAKTLNEIIGSLKLAGIMENK